MKELRLSFFQVYESGSVGLSQWRINFLKIHEVHANLDKHQETYHYYVKNGYIEFETEHHKLLFLLKYG
jgi:hypothetical protein